MKPRSQVLVVLTLLTGVAGAAAPSGADTAAPASSAALLERAFTIVAEGYPVEPAPGSQSQPIAIRPAASRVSLANPPASAYARAAAADLGLAEAYFGQRGPSAEVDTATEGEREESVDEEGVRLHAVVSETPSASASAELVAVGIGTTASDTAGRLTRDGRVVADASSEVRDATIGPLAVTGARFEAHASTSGLRGGGAGSGRVTVAGAMVGGVPVVVDDTGVRVDENLVPLAQLGAATAAVQRAMAEGGYSDIRVVQPIVTVAEDGRRVEVSGGGVAVYLTNNNPSNLYFLSLRGLGGRALVAVGDDIRTAGTDRPTTRSNPTGSASIDRFPGLAGPNGVGVSPSASHDASTEPRELEYADAGDRADLRAVWPGWPAVLLGGAGTIAGALAALRTRRGRRAADLLLDGYLRG